jgi:RNA polymerase sigma-70 factor (ECF subfamily)
VVRSTPSDRSEGNDEAALIRSARDGDGRAFAELLDPVKDRLWGVCIRVTGNRADADDALQDTLVAAWRGLRTFRGDSAFATWAHRIAANAALAVVRRRKDPSVDIDDERLADPSLSRRDFSEGVVVRDRVQNALRAVPEDFRVALVLREYGGFTYEEIAEHQSIPVQTVKSRLNRARTAMRTALAED